MAWVLVLLPAFLAGLVQGLTGFGAAIIMMIFLPQLMPIAQGAGVAGVAMLAIVGPMAWRYRRAVRWRRILVPFVIYASVAIWAVHLGKTLDVQLLRRLLGGLLCVLAVYFTFSKRASHQHYPWPIAGAFMVISGFFNGLFGIGGPLMALYFLSLSDDDPAAYLGNLQAFFFIDVIGITLVRIGNGILTPTQLPAIGLGLLGAFGGAWLAARILPKLPMAVVRQGIYLFIGLSGIYYLFF